MGLFKRLPAQLNSILCLILSVLDGGGWPETRPLKGGAISLRSHCQRVFSPFYHSQLWFVLFPSLMEIAPLEKSACSHRDVVLLLSEGKFDICLAALGFPLVSHNVPDNKHFP